MSAFVDEVRIHVEAGGGGHGMIAFRREKFVPRGGPSGGDGGRGGDIVLEVDTNLTTLLGFRYRRRFRARRGQHGSGSNRTGRSGERMVIPVPSGTEVRDHGTGELLGDLIEAGEELCVARGGRGGRGNARFATSTMQAPQTAEDGRPGEARELRLTLKLLADVGLVGLPNAGKSTLLSVVSAARPKIADYPFTTLEPHLGIVGVGEYGSFVMADIPGLIEGASEGKGLGHRFLRHVERTRVLLFLVEAMDPEPDRTLDLLRGELEGHAPELKDKPFLVALTKADLLGPGEDPPGIGRLGPEIRLISSQTGKGVDELKSALYRVVNEANDADASSSAPPKGPAPPEARPTEST